MKVHTCRIIAYDWVKSYQEISLSNGSERHCALHRTATMEPTGWKLIGQGAEAVRALSLGMSAWPHLVADIVFYVLTACSRGGGAMSDVGTRAQKVFETEFAGRACVVKERVKKSYRLPVLDKKLSHRRMVQEARCIMKCRRAGVATPSIFLIDEDTCRLYFEKMTGGSVKEFLRRAYQTGTSQQRPSCVGTCLPL
jgi:hypothetical protein